MHSNSFVTIFQATPHELSLSCTVDFGGGGRLNIDPHDARGGTRYSGSMIFMEPEYRVPPRHVRNPTIYGRGPMPKKAQKKQLSSNGPYR